MTLHRLEHGADAYGNVRGNHATQKERKRVRVSCFFLIALVLCLLPCLSAAAAATNQYNRIDKLWKDKKKSCESVSCAGFVPDEAMNCVNNCTSAECYTAVYAASPLEDGEIDSKRSREFIQCLRKAFKVRPLMPLYKQSLLSQ